MDDRRIWLVCIKEVGYKYHVRNESKVFTDQKKAQAYKESLNTTLDEYDWYNANEWIVKQMPIEDTSEG